MRLTLVTLYAAWPLAVIVAKLTARVRTRLLLVCAFTWVLALVIATTATPASKAGPAGLVFGASACLGLWLAVRDGVQFRGSDKIHFEDRGKTPRAEFVVLGVVALVDAAAVALAVTS
jgi:peptidoglycan/LPS O-acetylase OafA/YrhL